MGVIFLCFGVFVIVTLGLSATLFNCLSARTQDTSAAVTCLIVGVALSSIVTGLLAMTLGV